jgi:hypothetical protein
MAAPSEKNNTPMSQRTHKANPVIQSRDVVAQRRREMFFRRVQKERDDKKWDARGDQVFSNIYAYAVAFTDMIQIQRLDFISEQKRWEERKARQAPELEPDFLDDDVLDLTVSSYTSNSAPQTEQEMEEADYILAQEEFELQQLIASMEEAQSVPDNASQHYGSDDDDYDQIFMEVTDAASTEHPFDDINTNMADADAMDMTDG